MVTTEIGALTHILALNWCQCSVRVFCNRSAICAHAMSPSWNDTNQRETDWNEHSWWRTFNGALCLYANVIEWKTVNVYDVHALRAQWIFFENKEKVSRIFHQNEFQREWFQNEFLFYWKFWNLLHPFFRKKEKGPLFIQTHCMRSRVVKHVFLVHVLVCAQWLRHAK